MGMKTRIAAFDLDATEFLCSERRALMSLAEVGEMFTNICHAAQEGDAKHLRSFEFIGRLYPETPPRSRMSRELRVRILARDGGKCRRCGSTDDLEIDHIKAVVFGGNDDDDNLQTLCRPCNKAKGPQAYARRRGLEGDCNA
jgi:hypothetical protein